LNRSTRESPKTETKNGGVDAGSFPKGEPERTGENVVAFNRDDRKLGSSPTSDIREDAITFEALRDEWARNGLLNRTAWQSAPQETRRRFIDEVLDVEKSDNNQLSNTQ
jgi:hypothetical protein